MCDSDEENGKSVNSLDDDENESKQTQVSVQTLPSTSAQNTPPKRGKSRGEVFKDYSRSSLKRNIVDSPPIMIGRTPEIEIGQFEDTRERKTTNSTQQSRVAKISISSATTPVQKPEVTNYITPSPEPSTSRGAGRGAMLKKLMQSYTPTNGSRRSSKDSNYGSQTKSPAMSAHDLSSDIVELSPPSSRVIDGSSKVQSPETIVLSSTESLPQLETIVLSSTESSLHEEPISVSASASGIPQRSVNESISVESLPSDRSNVPVYPRVSEPPPQRPINPQERVFQKMEDEQTTIDEKLLDKIMIVGDCQFKPRYQLKDHNLDAELMEVMFFHSPHVTFKYSILRVINTSNI